ncbi:hypothetical protein AYJ54_43540 [Bradyrhizobium centrolobii]|uniref:Uncharacterized protein n=2 Tax=Bradyrhizobium centrolobii TaxID=1505087 RepID=A0A176Z047_9BRAD|nr:hypothetical protein AYJ54_43540 [Bradyrhizobium centrolobii]
MYENIRDQVQADAIAGIRLVGEPARQRAEELRREIERRGLFCTPIDWISMRQRQLTADLPKP